MKAVNHHQIRTDNIIYSEWCGDQCAGTVALCEKKLLLLSKQLRQKGQKVLILANINQLGSTSLSARYTGLNLIKKLDYDKTAIVGNSLEFGGIVEPVFQAAGQTFKMKMFSDTDKAEDWLKS